MPGRPRTDASTHRRYVILDRDGTIIVERHYLSDPDQVELLPGALAGLQRMSDLGLGLAIVTNQSGVARGFFDVGTVRAVHDRLERLLRDGGVTVDGIFFCPHQPQDGCPCRKPRPGLLRQAAHELGFDPERAFVIGDNAGDIELGRRVEAFSILVTTGYGAGVLASATAKPDAVAADLAEAADIIERNLRPSRSSSGRDTIRAAPSGGVPSR